MTNDELKKLIGLAEKAPEIAFDNSPLGKESDRFYSIASPNNVKAMAEELIDLRRHKNWAAKVITDMKDEVLAAREFRDQMDNYYVAHDLLEDETFKVHSDKYDAIRARNETEK